MGTDQWTLSRRLLGRTVAALVALVVVWPSTPAPALAGSTSDIPGIPLPAALVTGQLGGPIYDVVYSFDVPARYVVIVGMSGSGGTDFDLYLFDATATTVVTDIGVVAKASGPTSTENLAYSTTSGGRFYLDLNGATDVMGTFVLTVQIVPDPTPPLASITLAGGQPVVSSPTVAVDIEAYDDLSGAADLAFSEDGVGWSDWRPVMFHSSWTFTGGDGVKTLWLKVRNGVGLESKPVSASVRLDTVPPRITQIQPPPGTTVATLRPTFAMTFSEPIDSSTWSNLGLIVQEAGGGLVHGSYIYDGATATGAFVPGTDLIAGAAYVVTVGNVRDVAGNQVIRPGSWTVVPVLATTLTGKAVPGIISVGTLVRVSATFAGPPGFALLDVAARTGGATDFVNLASVPVQSGTVSIDARPERNTWYRFSYAGDFGVAPAQVDVRVIVRRSVALVGASGSVVSRARVGQSVTLVAAVGPAEAGVPLSFQLYRFDAAHRRWVYAGSKGRGTDSSGQASLAWTPTTVGSYYWRVSVSPTPEFANNVSPVYRWSVSR